ncbi:MAG: hypothetical protein H6728_07400 [Myxococcales bacterium]|nr:hypothetical protein [Myxococcales bacterium]MCB9642886.1 hypothetical protein [Myxococcales bacterium]
MKARPFWKRLALTCGALVWLGISLPANAQLDIFEGGGEKPPPGRRGFTFGPIKINKQAGAKEMARGNTFYAQKNYAAASLMFYRVVKNAAGSRYFQAAQFQLALSLYRMGLFHAALDYFTDIIRVGVSHRYFKRALTYSITVSRKLRNESMFLGKLRNFNIKDFPNQYRDELLYLLGKYYFQRRDLALEKRLPAAQRLLNRVRSRKPEFFARAQYILGAIYDSAGAAHANKAAQAFKRSARAAMRIKDKKMRQRVFELGIMGIARIHYSSEHFTGATYWYQAIPRNSPRWLDSIFEMAWSFLRVGKYEETLGIIHTLRSPYFQNEFYPEVGILRAVSYFERCRYSQVKKIIGSYLKRYRPMINELNRYLVENPTDLKMYATIKKLRDQREEKETTVKGLEDDPQDQMFQRILKLTFRDKPLQFLFLYINELEKEIQIIRASSQAWQQSSIGIEMMKRLREDLASKIKDAGARARDRIQGAQNELKALVGQALKINYETLSAQKDRINRASSQSGGFTMRVKGQDDKNRKLITVSVSDDYTFWPFQKEYWIDELGYYRYRIKGECHR